MNLINEIQNDILTPSTPLSSILRKAKVLAYQLKNAEFKEWVDQELNGYSSNANMLPDYRKAGTQSRGYFVGRFGKQFKNAPIPTFDLPQGLGEFGRTLVFLEGVRALESMVESESESFQYPWPAEYVAVLANAVYEAMVCLAAWKPTSKSQIEQVLDTIRNRLLNFILELEQIQPDVGETTPGAQPLISSEKVKQVFNNYILGGHNVITPGTSSFQGDIDMSDKIDMSGDFRGAILNIKSTLTDVTQSIDVNSKITPAVKDELKQLVEQLNEALQQVPSQRNEEAEAVAESAKSLIETATKEKPNKAMIQVSAEGLKMAAKNLAEITPTVLVIATKIAEAIAKFIGLNA